MLYGIPPKMSLQPKGPWWSNSPNPALKDSTIHPKVRALFGMSDHHDDTDPSRDGLRLLNILMSNQPSESFLVRVIFSDKVQGDVPESPTAFSDASFTNPSMPHFGLASAAVWWPGRIAQLSILELLHFILTITSNPQELPF